MILCIPVFSERIQRADQGRAYRIAPAFPSMPWQEAPSFEVTNPREDRALEELTRILRKEFNLLAKKMRHDELLRWSFHPALVGKQVGVEIYLRKQSLKGEMFVVTYHAMGRKIVTLPKLPGLCFDIERGKRIEDRTNEVLTKYFRKKEKQSEGKLELDSYLCEGQSRLTTIEVKILAKQKFEKPENPAFVLLGGSGEMSGAQELEKVGRCLNRLPPNHLSRAILRDEKIAVLEDHFNQARPNPQPLVLTGPSLVGKSAIIHEYLFQQIAGQQKPPEIWLISPQRMISGMSHVGQWEERAHAIFREARKRNYLLLFEDLPGLFQAGKTRDSDLSIGHVLKAHFEEGGLRVIAEATPESWRKLREIDRGFADFFRSLPIAETSARDTLRILIRTTQEIEGRQRGTYFEPDLIPTVFDLQNRYARSRAFPGKAVEIIQQLAQKYANQELDREAVYTYFQTRTGIQRQFLHQRISLDRSEIMSFFEQRIKGQTSAINSMTDLVTACLAQLNEPGRPLGSMLFLGPTGVGKTESAKTLAEYFFGTSERLLRFDMNEFVGPDAPERLIGSPYRPRGLLTGAVRRQPYAVILLDEIEKAHPRVFDLLLQLLDDGRLTDAAGETADFCNCIIIMTSNLGARTARHQLGFTSATQDDDHVYREAAEKFFRPELFNRLDHIVPFGDLSREDIESLVALMSEKALSRIGLSETQLSLKIHPQVHARLAKMGFKPGFGARALRRSVEEFLIEPIALRISELPKNQPAVVSCQCDADSGLSFETTALSASPHHGLVTQFLPISEHGQFIDSINEFLDRIEDDLESWRDESSEGTIDPAAPMQMRYFAMREDIMGIRRMRDHYLSVIESEIRYRKDNPAKPSPNSITDNLRFLPNHDPDDFLIQMYRTTDANRYIKNAIESTEPFDHIREIMNEIINRANAIDLIVAQNPNEDDRIVIDIHGPDRKAIFRHWQFPIKNWLEIAEIHQVTEYCEFNNGSIGEFTIHTDANFSWDQYWKTAFLIAEGPALYDFLKHLAGTSLVVSSSGKAAFADIRVTKLPKQITPAKTRDWLDKQSIPDRFEVNTIQSDEDPAYIDLASGFMTNQTENRIWKCINPHLPVAHELRHFQCEAKHV